MESENLCYVIGHALQSQELRELKTEMIARGDETMFAWYASFTADRRCLKSMHSLQRIQISG